MELNTYYQQLLKQGRQKFEVAAFEHNFSAYLGTVVTKAAGKVAKMNKSLADQINEFGTSDVLGILREAGNESYRAILEGETGSPTNIGEKIATVFRENISQEGYMRGELAKTKLQLMPVGTSSDKVMEAINASFEAIELSDETNENIKDEVIIIEKSELPPIIAAAIEETNEEVKESEEKAEVVADIIDKYTEVSDRMEEEKAEKQQLLEKEVVRGEESFFCMPYIKDRVPCSCLKFMEVSLEKKMDEDFFIKMLFDIKRKSKDISVENAVSIIGERINGIIEDDIKFTNSENQRECTVMKTKLQKDFRTAVDKFDELEDAVDELKLPKNGTDFDIDDSITKELVVNLVDENVIKDDKVRREDIKEIASVEEFIKVGVRLLKYKQISQEYLDRLNTDGLASLECGAIVADNIVNMGEAVNEYFIDKCKESPEIRDRALAIKRGLNILGNNEKSHLALDLDDLKTTKDVIILKEKITSDNPLRDAAASIKAEIEDKYDTDKYASIVDDIMENRGTESYSDNLYNNAITKIMYDSSIKHGMENINHGVLKSMGTSISISAKLLNKLGILDSNKYKESIINKLS